MAKTKVSKLIRVKQGRSTIEFELEDTKLTINLFKQGSGVPPNKITIQEEAIEVLRAMLGGPMLPLAKLATRLPPDSLTDAQRAEHVSPDLEGEGDMKEGMA